MVPWQSWAASCVRSGRGGVLVAGDARQSLYQDDPSMGLEVDRVVELRRAYRSTCQIMDVAQTMASSTVPALDAEPPEGTPVQLIFGSRWTTKPMLSPTRSKRWSRTASTATEMSPCCTRGASSQANRLVRTLEDNEIPFHWVNRDGESRRTVLKRSRCRRSTPAKGREFPVVFVFGVEALKAAEARQRNIGYVAATRAKDQLVLTYTRPNDMIRAISDHDDVESWTWPDDWGT